MRLTDPWFAAVFVGGGYVGRPCEGPCSLADPAPGHTHDGYEQLPSIRGAQALFLYCPCAFGTDRAHGLLVPFRNPHGAELLPEILCPTGRHHKAGDPRPRWEMSGNSLADLTLTPSIAVGKDPECWHGFITAGEVK